MGSTSPLSGNGPPAAHIDRAAERTLRAEVQVAVGRLLGERGLLTPDREGEERIRALIGEQVAAHQRRAAATNSPLIADPEGVEARIFDSLLRLGILQPLMEMPAVEEIICNGPNRIFVIEDGQKRLLPDLYFDDDDELRSLVKRLLGPLGKRLDEASPMVDARLPDGSRLNAAIPPATIRYCSVTIRKFILRAHSLEQLVALGTLTESAAQFLDAAVQAGVNILVSGPTGSGKCVAGDTLVTLADGGLVPIGGLVETSIRDGIDGSARASNRGSDGWTSAPASQEVLTCDFLGQKIRPAVGCVAWRHPAPEVLIEVLTRTGKSVRVTPEHPFFTVIGGLIAPIRADELVNGQYVAAATGIPVAGKLPNLLDLLGDDAALYVCGEAGLIREAVARIARQEGLSTLRSVYDALGLPWGRGRFWRSENAIPLSAFQRLCSRAGVHLRGERVIGLKSKTGRYACKLPLSPSADLSRLAGMLAGDGHAAGTCVELTSGSPSVRDRFSALCEAVFGKRPKTRPADPSKCPTLVLMSLAATEVMVRAYSIPRGAKSRIVRAPRWLFSAPEEHIAAYLSGLLDTDGSVQGRTRNRTALVEFCTTSAGLAEDIEALLLRLGVRSHRARRGNCSFVRVYDIRGIARLGEVLDLSHPARRDALRTQATAGLYSGVDVIPGLEEPMREARLAAGLSYTEMARVWGVSSWLPAMYERGERHPSRARALALAARAPGTSLAEKLRTIGKAPVFWDRVVATRTIRNHGEAYVYDLTVPETHTFLTGSGGLISHNTTLLNALGASIASMDERVITVEEVAELQLERCLPDCVALQSRAGNLEGAGQIRIRDLVRNALRMRPTRIVVGEVRGAEALDMLLAMNTGHDGSLTTIHGNSPRDALDRLATLAMMAEERLSGEALAKMVARTIELVLQLRFEPKSGRRRVVGVFEVAGLEGSVITGQDLWTLEASGDRLSWTGIQPRCLAKIIAKGVSYSLPHLPGERP